MKKKLPILKHRVIFLQIHYQEDEEGNAVEFYTEKEKRWASVLPLSMNKQPLEGFLGHVDFSKIIGLYKIVMRNNYSRNARHAYLNTLRWKDKILNLFYQFNEDVSERWLYTIAFDCGRKP